MLKRLPLDFEISNFSLVGNVVSEHTATAVGAISFEQRDRTGKTNGLDILVNTGALPIPFPTNEGGTVSIVCDVYTLDEYDAYQLDSSGEYDFTVLRSEVYSNDTDWIQQVTVAPTDYDEDYVLVPSLGGTVILNTPATPSVLNAMVMRNLMSYILTGISFTYDGFEFSWEEYDEITVGIGVAYDSSGNALLVLEEAQTVEPDYDQIEDEDNEMTAAVYVDTDKGTIELEYGDEAAEGASTVSMPTGDNVIPLGYITFGYDEYGEGTVTGAEVYSE